MPDIQYIGEYLIPRQIGHFAVVLSFVAALLATIAYFFSTQRLNAHDTPQYAAWQRLGRWSFGVHGVAVMTVIVSLFYVMLAKRYEYFYAHSHVNDNLENRYVFSAFWEGQEGSFLLWMFWHVGLGAWIILRGSLKSTWESPVLAVLASVQVFLSSMILGLHFGWGEHIIKWGSNPTLLLREVNDAPIFNQADYVEKIRGSAKGLNELLQNAWMTIHPPTLFLGFASTTVPFCFAVAGLWRRQYTEWLRPALPYALFSAAILGTGIMMGGMWAYEALSFNGYWAWDPVENTSLVPWITLVAGIHTHLIAKSTGHSLRATVVFYCLTFLLILYSTFLTRSGILGDSSAHAFTEMGLEWQLVLFQLFYIGVSLFFLLKHYKKIPNPQKEETVSSREFWMFIGSLVLLLSVVLISFTTSIPVFNKIGGYIANWMGSTPPRFTEPVDRVMHYNKTQLWIGVFIGILSAFTQFLRYKEFNFNNYKKTLFKHLAITGALTALLMIPALYWIEARAWQYILLLFAGIFTVVANGDYALTFFKGNPKASGSAVAHVGFGILIVGILASGLNKKWISHNRFAMEGLGNFTEEQLGKYILLFKNAPMFMNGYWVTYERDTAYKSRRDFTISMKKMSADLKTTLDSFTVHPYILMDKTTGRVAANNPDTRHFLTYDIFTNIASLPPGEQDPEIARQEEDSLKYQLHNLVKGVPFQPVNRLQRTPKYTVTVDGWDMKPTHPRYIPEDKDVAVGVKMTFRKGLDSVYNAAPLILLRGGDVYQLPSTINDLGVRVKVDPSIFDKIFMTDKDLIVKDFELKEGGSFNLNNKKITLIGLNPKAQPEGFELQKDDLALGIKVRITTEGGQSHTAEPVYVIRGNQPIPLRAQVPDLGLSVAVTKVNPAEQSFTFSVAERDPAKLTIPIEIAEDAPGTDYLVMEATVNPGINLVWTGCIMMMIGLAMAMFYRIKK